MSTKKKTQPKTKTKPEFADCTAPDYVLQNYGIKTQRQWRRIKRGDLDHLCRAFRTYLQGSAYCPSKNGEVGQISVLLEKLKSTHSPQRWGL